MIYLASPYSGTVEQMQERYLAAEASLAYWLLAGKIVYSPIVQCHALAARYEMPTDFNFWQHHNRGMLRVAEELWLLTLDGWTESKGVTAETTFAQQCGIPVFTLHPTMHTLRKFA